MQVAHHGDCFVLKQLVLASKLEDRNAAPGRQNQVTCCEEERATAEEVP